MNFKGWRTPAATQHLDRFGSKKPDFHSLRTLLHSWKEPRYKVLLTNYCSKNTAVPHGNTMKNSWSGWGINWLMEQWKQTQLGCMLAFNHRWHPVITDTARLLMYQTGKPLMKLSTMISLLVEIFYFHNKHKTKGPFKFH